MNDHRRERPERPDHTATRGDQPVPAAADAALQRIGDALHGLRYGSVLAIVQDGFVVQIERTEKTRFVR